MAPATTVTAKEKERLEVLEASLGTVQNDLHKATDGMAEKIAQIEGSFDERLRSMEQSFTTTLEEAMNRMRELMVQNRESGSSAPPTNARPGAGFPPLGHRTERHDQTAPYQARHQRPKLKLQRFSGGDPTEWLSKVKQLFSYQDIPVDQYVSFAAFHLTEEANEWWMATAKKLKIHPLHAPWDVFEEELWTRFGPTEGENFHMALSKIRQTGSLLDYQREFEKLQNKVHNWSEEALVGTFLGGLNESIANHVQMFAPTTLKDVI